MVIHVTPGGRGLGSFHRGRGMYAASAIRQQEWPMRELSFCHCSTSCKEREREGLPGFILLTHYSLITLHYRILFIRKRSVFSWTKTTRFQISKVKRSQELPKLFSISCKKGCQTRMMGCQVWLQCFHRLVRTVYGETRFNCVCVNGVFLRVNLNLTSFLKGSIRAAIAGYLLIRPTNMSTSSSGDFRLPAVTSYLPLDYGTQSKDNSFESTGSICNQCIL